jgi:hypothetical protein
MRVIFSPANFARPLVAVDISDDGVVNPYAQVSQHQLISGIEGRRFYDPVHLYFGSEEGGINLEKAVTIRRAGLSETDDPLPPSPLLMEVQTIEFWAAVAFLSRDLPKGEEVALVLPDAISEKIADDIEPLGAMLLTKTGEIGEALPKPQCFAQGELLLWDWYAKILNKDLGVAIEEARIKSGDEVTVALVLEGSNEDHSIVSTYDVSAVEQGMDTGIEIVRKAEPQVIDKGCEIDGPWDHIFEPSAYSSCGGITVKDGVELSVASGLIKRQKMNEPQPEVDAIADAEETDGDDDAAESEGD